MRQYGYNKATEFTKKQIGVIYGMAKRNELKVEKWVMTDFYGMADYYGYDDNRGIEEAETKILNILKAAFEKDLETAQELIDRYTEYYFKSLSMKEQQKIDRTLVA